MESTRVQWARKRTNECLTTNNQPAGEEQLTETSEKHPVETDEEPPKKKQRHAVRYVVSDLEHQWDEEVGSAKSNVLGIYATREAAERKELELLQKHVQKSIDDDEYFGFLDDSQDVYLQLANGKRIRKVASKMDSEARFSFELLDANDKIKEEFKNAVTLLDSKAAFIANWKKSPDRKNDTSSSRYTPINRMAIRAWEEYAKPRLTPVFDRLLASIETWDLEKVEDLHYRIEDAHYDKYDSVFEYNVSITEIECVEE